MQPTTCHGSQNYLISGYSLGLSWLVLAYVLAMDAQDQLPKYGCEGSRLW